MRNSDKQRVAGAANAWLLASVRQAQRVLSGTLDDEQDVEFMLFCTALNNAARGARAVLGAKHPQVAAFKSAAPDAKDMRDMLEHFDHYLTGRGRLQPKPSPDQPRAPWIMMQTGTDSFTPGGSEYRMVILTKIGGDASQRSFELDVRSSLSACAALVDAAISEAGILLSSEAVRRAREI